MNMIFRGKSVRFPRVYSVLLPLTDMLKHLKYFKSARFIPMTHMIGSILNAPMGEG